MVLIVKQFQLMNVSCLRPSLSSPGDFHRNRLKMVEFFPSLFRLLTHALLPFPPAGKEEIYFQIK